MNHLPTAEVAPGTIIDGKYKVTTLLGEGGMGKVFRVTHVNLGKTFALKLMSFSSVQTNPQNASEVDSSRLIRFKREAEALAKINHPNVVSITDFGVTTDEFPYIVMEYVDGKALRDVLDEKTFSEREAVQIIKQVCAGIHEAHVLGIIHRDLKPENIMIQRLSTGEMLARVLDFGIAKLTDKSKKTGEKSITGTGTPGTMKYMAPEQFMGLEIDPRTDVFTICLILYEMLTGEIPPVMIGKYKSLAEMRPGVTPGLNLLVSKGLSLAPEDRPQSALELRNQLDKLEQGDLFSNNNSSLPNEQSEKMPIAQGHVHTNPINSAKTFTSVSNNTSVQALNNTELVNPNYSRTSTVNSIVSIGPEETKSSNWVRYLVITLVIIALAGGGGYAYLMSLKTKDNKGISTGKIDPIKEFLPETVSVRTAEFTMGSNKGDIYSQPEHSVKVDAFEISKFLITNKQYGEFVRQTKRNSPKHWKGEAPPANLQDAPVSNVNREDAEAYCKWLSTQTNKVYRLPSEKEWEYVAKNDVLTRVEELFKYNEWIEDIFSLYPGSKINPKDPKVPGKDQYIFRGRGNPDNNYSEPKTFRAWAAETFSNSDLGFRVVCAKTGDN